MSALLRRSSLVIPLVAGSLAITPLESPAQQERVALGALQRSAELHDPRAAQVGLNERASALREGTLSAELLPSVSFHASGQYQSHVARIPFALPGGGMASEPQKDSYDAHIAVRQLLFDPTHAARRDVERVRRAEQDARLGVALYSVREAVNEAFFAALRLHAQGEEISTAVSGLESHLAAARSRVQEGVSLQSEVASLEAELLSRRQVMDELAVAERSTLAVLARLTGSSVESAASLVLPELSGTVMARREGVDALGDRPEFDHFESTRRLLGERQRVISARELPSVSAFARTGYGRPGLNPLAQEFDSYWLAGVQLQWTPWSWGSMDREREELVVQQRVVDTEEAVFTERILRAAATERATIGRLLRSLESDEEIIVLRERILGESRSRYREGVITAAEFIDRENEALQARIARAIHRVELEHACARYLTLMGVEVE